MSRSRELTYEQALAELDSIVSRIESEEIDVDVLAEQVKRGAELIALCKKRLRSVDEEVQKALGALDTQETGA